MIEFQVLGGLAVTDGGGELALGGPRQRRLVAMLLIHRGEVVSVDRLAEAVFAGEPTPAAGTTLRSYVARLRKVVDRPGSAPTVLTQAPGYRLDVAPEAVDAARFERHLADAGKALDRADHAAASAAATDALRLWRGNPYAEFADEDWARPEAQRLHELRLVAHERLVEAELGLGRAAQVIPALEALVVEHPLRESFRAQLMLALYRSGRQADALRAATEHREVLREELGLDPSPAIDDLERRILDHDPNLRLDETVDRALRGYRLGERLGTGSDGTVHAARLPGVDRECAIRIVRAEVADDPAFVRSFEATVHRVASLRHPAVVPVHDYWREPGAAYVVLRRLHGGSLAERLERGPLAPPAAAAVASRIGGALVEAAEHGVVHGRLRPTSVLYDEAGDPYLGDFELAPSGIGPDDDRRAFAALVAACLDPAPAAVAALLADDGLPLHDLVPALVAAIDGSTVELERPNPYKGLRAFDEADADDFYGRADLLAELLRRLGGDGPRGRLVLLVGGSGTGKSSVVRAGLVPRLRRGAVPGSEGWFVATMLPGSAPFKELAAALRLVAVGDAGDGEADLAGELVADAGGIDRVLRRVVPDGGQVLLVLDQFEELFTLAGDAEQRAFLDGLLHAVRAPDSRLRVIATLRADFYDRPLAVRGFGAVVNAATVTIPAMTAPELESAIVEPAGRVGGTVDRALVAELVSAVADEPAALPSLQFTLYELAERSPSKALTSEAYRAIGGVSGAIAARAEQLYLTLDDDERTAVRQLFERLVVVTPDGEPSRRRADRAELSALGLGDAFDEAVDRWAAARLLTLDRHAQSRQPTVEVAHEALLRSWPRLQQWIAEDREAIVVLGQLREAASGWEALGCDPGALYRGARLQVALDVVGHRDERLPAREKAFLDASRSERDREERDVADRVARQARANRRLRIQLGAIAVALVVALVGGFVAVDQRRDAERERSAATSRELAAASVANLTEDPELSVLLALAAVDEADGSGATARSDAENALHRAVTANRTILRVAGIGGSLDWSPDGRTFVTEGPERSGLVDVRDAQTGETVLSFEGHGVDVNDVAYSADGSMLATTGDDGAVRVWDAATGDEIASHVEQDASAVWGPSFSPDGTLVAASWFDDRRVRVIDLASGAVVADLPAETTNTDFSPDGTRLVWGDLAQARPVVVDVATGDETVRPGLESEQFVRDARWSPDGRWIASTTGIGLVNVYDAATGDLVHALTSHVGEVEAVTWSPDSARIASASTDGTAVVSEVTPTVARERFSLSARGTRSGLYSVAFSPDGGRLMAGDAGVTEVVVWDVDVSGGAEWQTVSVPQSWDGASFAPDGGTVLVTGPGGAVLSVDVESGIREVVLDPATTGTEDDVYRVELSPDGELLAVSYFRGGATVWDLAEQRELGSVPAEFVADLAWSADSSHLAVSLFDEAGDSVAVLDRSGLEVGRVTVAEGMTPANATLSPDGSVLAFPLALIDRNEPAIMDVQLWDWAAGTQVATIDSDTPLAGAHFSPDGERLVTSGYLQGVNEVWDVATGELLATLTAPPITNDLVVSRDGTTIATAHTDGTVRLWDAETGVQRLVLEGHDRIVHTVELSPDGRRLVSVGDDGLARVWALDLDDLVGIATGRLTRGFVDEECRQFLHLDRCATP